MNDVVIDKKGNEYAIICITNNEVILTNNEGTLIKLKLSQFIKNFKIKF